MTRTVRVAAAQMGPIGRDETRSQVVQRLVAMMHEAKSFGAHVVAFPELALTTFFARWYFETQQEVDQWFETSMPSAATQPLFDTAAALGIGFYLGFAERTDDGHYFNSSILVDATGHEVGRYRKVHVPGHSEHEPWRKFQHLERRYFEPGDRFDVWPAFGGVAGMALCNDRRWPETYRMLSLQGCEIAFIGYNTPIHYAPDPSQDALAGFHNHLVMQSGAYQNGMWVVGVAKGGVEEGVDSLAQSCIIAPSGEIVAQCTTTGDEVIVADCDLDRCENYRGTLFNFARYRRPEVYSLITRTQDTP